MRIGILLIAYMMTVVSLQSASSENNRQLEKDFETRLAYYVDIETQDFLADMTVREKLLLQMIRNITAEIDIRGTQFQSPHLSLLQPEQKSDDLTEQYSTELEKIVTLVEEMDTLRRRAEAAGDLSSWRQLRTLHERLVQSIESDDLARANLSSQTRASSLLKEQDAEINSLVRMYERLEALREMPEVQENQIFLGRMTALQDSIRQVLGALDSTQTDELVAAYFEEAETLVAILKELDGLHSQAVIVAPDVCIEIQALRRSVLKQLPNRLPPLLGYDKVILSEEHIPRLVREWKAHQYVDYTVRLTRYDILKRSLINGATPAQLRRMRARELYDALHNYSHGAHRLARMQFDRMLRDYGTQHEDLATLHFYRGETAYAQHLHDDAERDYLVLVSEYPNSEYLGESLFRLMQMHARKPDRGKFSELFRLLQSYRLKIDAQTLDKCLYLAGYVQLQDGDIRTAEETLTAISPDFLRYGEAQLLIGIARAGQGQYGEAITIFRELIEAQPANEFVRNSAQLRLGYLYYEQGELDLALQHFGHVSPQFAEHDKALLAIAWTHLKQDNYTGSVATIELLNKHYLNSETLYEGLMLSAHAKLLLDDSDASQEDLRYIANARAVLELSDRYNSERQLILDQINTLDRLEQRAIEQNDRSMFQLVDSYRTRLQDALMHFEVRGARGNFVLENLETERIRILSQLEQLERLMARAEASDEEEVLKAAQKQHARLTKIPQLYQSDPETHRRHFFLDYPLATREGTAKYRNRIVSELASEIMREKTKLQTTLAQISELRTEFRQKSPDAGGSAKLDLMHSELSRLHDRTQWLQSWLWENDAPAPQTDFNRYADFSGFGMSDATFAAIEQKEEAIAELSSHKNVIAKLILDRKKYLEEKVRAYEAEILRLEKENREEYLRHEMEERQEYLQESYFDTTDRMLPDSEQPIPDSESNQHE